jgi:hypothetical protein
MKALSANISKCLGNSFLRLTLRSATGTVKRTVPATQGV